MPARNPPYTGEQGELGFKGATVAANWNEAGALATTSWRRVRNVQCGPSLPVCLVLLPVEARVCGGGSRERAFGMALWL